MLDSETKSRIDSARDILVGKVPDPKSQVEQITIALIYKFMDDMDRQSEELGGKATFFAGEFKKYRWAQLLDKRYSGHERLLLYAEGIEKMNVNKNIPQLFRAIFKGVFLPYRDPETLNLFLKEIDGFTYEHSERLGDAFEYLLSVLGTQGDAGQFRTPRHIIDFIVAVVDPKKNETVLDPACGTAGFLISAYKHILRGAKPAPPAPLPAGEGGRHYRGGFDFAGMTERARELRRGQTDAEGLLWELLRNRQLAGAKFRRQHQFGDYICDFFCPEAKLVIECDGPVHETHDRQKTDRQRDAYLRSQGLTVIRFENDRVMNDIDKVLVEIASYLPSPDGRGGGGEGVASSDLTPDERAQMMQNFRGYDIAPDMVRLARANLYLHGFPNPVLHEYDTLTSEERWDERCDVILANPPFMTPKGGIRPHNRFSIQAKRSEVLFVDYIAEHLNPGGRAGVIVPEGIIFQSQNAYRQLRKMLVENYLWAVVSLPAGVFNPYSGVKTSILFLDRNLARRMNEVLFVKVENDGFDLGAQRRPIDKNDLPAALKALLDWKVGTAVPAVRERKTDASERRPYLSVPRARLLESPDTNLSGDRYLVAPVRPTGKWPMTKLGEVCTFLRGVTYDKGDESSVPTAVAVLRANNIELTSHTLDLTDIKYLREQVQLPPEKILKRGDIFICTASGSKDHLGKVAFIASDTAFFFGGFMGCIRCSDAALPLYVFHGLTSPAYEGFIQGLTAGVNINNLKGSDLLSFQLPLPPLDEQERIVAELEGYRKVIEGARQILAAYKPTIRIDPDWPVVPLGDLAVFRNGLNYSKDSKGTGLKVIGVSAFQDRLVSPIADLEEVNPDGIADNDDMLADGDLVFVRSNGNKDLVGRCLVVETGGERVSHSAFTIRLRFNTPNTLPLFYAILFRGDVYRRQLSGRGANISNLSQDILRDMEIPLPPLAIQRQIVAELEAERKLVEANRELIARMEAKIKAKLAEVWGE